METVPTYQFTADDYKWLEHLQQEGYVVVKDVLSPEQVIEARKLLWDGIEDLVTGVKRDNLETWEQWNLDRTGLIPELAQSEGQWFVRGVDKVKQVFAHISFKALRAGYGW